MSHALAELDRRLACIVRLGVVAALDADSARVRVASGGITTDWLPWVTARAGATRTWSAPRAGEQGLLLCPSGDTGQAVFLAGIYSDTHPAPSASQDVESVLFPDGSRVTFDSAAHLLTVDVGAGAVVVNCASATVNATSGVTLDTPETHCTGALVVDGLLTWKGGMAGSGGSGATIQGAVAVTGGDVSADGIGLKSHHHTEQGDGAATSAAQA